MAFWAGEGWTQLSLDMTHFVGKQASCSRRLMPWLHDDDDDEIAYFTVRWKTRKLVLSAARIKYNYFKIISN